MDKILEFKNYLRSHWKNSRSVPRLDKMSIDFGVDRQKIVEWLRYLETEGFIKRNYNQYKVNNEKIKSVKNILNADLKNLTIPALRIIMLIIGVGASIMSIYYTAVWLLEFLNPVLSIMLSLIMVLFSISSFETIIVFWNQKKKLLSAVFALLFLIVVMFSMTSTVAGQYNSRIKNYNELIKESKQLSLKKQTLQYFKMQEETFLIEIEEKKQQLKTMNDMLSEFNLENRNEENRIFSDTYKKIKKIDASLQELRNSLSNIRKEKIDFLKNQNEVGLLEEIESGSFYVWLQSVTGVDKKYTEFWLSMIPAIFIDIMAPLSIAVAMFLRKKEKKNV